MQIKDIEMKEKNSYHSQYFHDVDYHHDDDGVVVVVSCTTTAATGLFIMD